MTRFAPDRRRFNGRLIAAGAAVALPSAQAQTWPSRPIRVIVPYTPGGFTDVTARLVAQKLQERLGQPVGIDNKPGANSIIGVDLIAKAPPDGHTIGVVMAAYAANTTLPEAAVRPCGRCPPARRRCDPEPARTRPC